MRRILLLVLMSALHFGLRAQICTYLAYDAFDEPINAPLHARSGGTGWSTAWNVQNSNTNVPGYQIANANGSLAYPGLQALGNHAMGGRLYLTAGRRFNIAGNGPFAPYVINGNAIGSRTGDTLWVSVLLRKDENNAEPVVAALHNSSIETCYPCANQRIGVGYFGAPSDVAGQRRWSLELNNTYYPTPMPVVSGAPMLFVLRIVFVAGNTQVALYANPTDLGNAGPPPVPTLVQSTGTANTFRSLSLYLGQDPGSGAVDEVRLARRYACVTPDAGVNVNLPPLANIVAAPTTGPAPLAVTFDGSGSFDPEGQTLDYWWNFGDGTPPFQGGSIVSHTYGDTYGIISASLTVRDSIGLEHTVYQNITVLDANGTFPCQSSFFVNRMPSCGATNGHVTVSANVGTTYALRNAANMAMPLTNTNQFANLAPGQYTFTASGANGCRDTFQLHLLTDSTTCPGWQPSMCAMDIGTNLSGLADWAQERPFRNLMKHVRPAPVTYSTTCNCWEAGVLEQMTFDANGYPTHLPQVTTAGNDTRLRYVISSNEGNLIVGEQYVFLYDGTGTITIHGGISVQSSTPGRLQFTNTSGGNIWLQVAVSQAADPVRNFRLLRLSDEFADLAAAPFYDVFLEKIAPLKALRFMDWGATNGNANTDWANRSSMGRLTYSGDRGAPYEAMIQLANIAQKDMWICVPHLADSQYLAQMATLFRDNLDPGLTVYLEYSNEVWNWIFSQAQYNDQNRPNNLSYGRAYSEKSKKVFRIWHAVYGPQKNRVKRVLGLQAVNTGLNQQILAQIPQSEWDLGSPTHYFGLNHGATGNPVLSASSSPQDIINNASNNWLAEISTLRQTFNMVKILGKKIVTYEGGQHFVGNVFGIPYPYQNAMWAAQYTPEMYTLYDAVLDSIRAWGNELALQFTLASTQESVYGSWGAMSHIDIQPPYLTTAPKYQVLLDNICPEPPPFAPASPCAVDPAQTTWFVDDNAAGNNTGTSWANAFTDLQAALAAASFGDNIVVAEGLYFPTNGPNREASFVLKAGVDLYGGFPDGGNGTADPDLYLTVLSGDIGAAGVSADNAHRVLRGLNVGDSLTVCGFTIRDGYTAARNGGGVYLQANGAGAQCSPRFQYCTVEGNYSGGKGGGAFVYAFANGAANPRFDHCTFVENTAANDGGALATLAQSGGMIALTIAETAFDTNTTPKKGGAIATWTNPGGTLNVQIEGGSFTGNTAQGNGGAVYNYVRGGGTSVFDVLNSAFQNNAGAAGGAIFQYASGGPLSSTLEYCTFEANSANGSGGALCTYAEFAGGTVNQQLQACTIQNSFGLEGGALGNLALRGGTSSLSGSGTLFADNVGNGRGGALFQSANSLNQPGTSATSSFVNSLFHQNIAPNGPGGALAQVAFANTSSSVSLGNCTVQGSSAYGQGAVVFSSSANASAVLNASNSIFWGNVSLLPTGKAFWTNNATASANLAHCLLEAPTCAANAAGLGAFACGAGMLFGTDPQFVDAANGDLHLLPGSPALDAGTLLGAPAIDFDSVARPQGNGIDLGAFEAGAARPLARETETRPASLGARLFPNPTEGWASVVFDRPVNGRAELCGLGGQVLEVVLLQETLSSSFDLRQYANGTYLVRLVTEEATWAKLLFLQK